ncbi:MAG: hypothetical protein EZS28_008443 [Streblomastix strix]|uniref:Right handed beta helix domain-containing protein n=1 Tax=Streblomastix strix TaxID=222440 RepID=A0A5J4WM15_9EUKA|nr:MAG: hypothetical protein EZS28_008443 [Streblomastix strix]
MFTALLLAIVSSYQIALNPQSIHESNEIVEYYVSLQGQASTCGTSQNRPCMHLYTVLQYVSFYEQVLIHVDEGTYELPLSTFQIFNYNDSGFPTVDIVAEEDSQIKLEEQYQSIGQIIISFSNFSIDFADLFFQIDDDGSSLKFSSCNLFRNAGNTAINSHSLVIVDRGSLILEKLNINGNSLEGNEALIQSSQPLLIQFTSLNITNISLIPGNTSPLLLSVTYNQTSSLNNDDSSTKPILLIENSEIIQNTLAPIQESCAIQIEGLKPQQILIKNSTINNRSPPNNDQQYEFKIVLPSDSILQDLINQFQTVEFGIILNPITVKTLPDEQFSNLAVPLNDEYANIQVNNNGQQSCSSYIANYYNDVQSIGCAVIIIRAQDNLGLFKGVPRSVSITGSFTENDLRTDGLNISFTGQNSQSTSNQISFLPNLPISYNPIDDALFRIQDGGQVTLNNLFIQRSNITGSENAPIVIIKSGAVQQSNGQQKNAAGQIVINKCILEGGNSISSDAWYNQGLAETCNVGYYAAIVADGQTTVQISGSNIRKFEGPAVRALNGASVSIDKNTTLDNNGLRNRNTLNSMQTNVVCEGGIGTTTVDIALDNVTSFNSTGNGWIFSSSDNTCDIRATFNGEVALPRSLPLINTANVAINNTNQQVEVTINGKYLEPCISRLILEIHEKNKTDIKVTQEFGIESSSITVNWIDSDNIIFQLPLSYLKDLNTKTLLEISVYESEKRDFANWISIQIIIDDPEQQPGPEEEEKEEQIKKKTNLIVGIVVPIVVIIVAVAVFFIVLVVYKKHKQQTKSIHQTERNDNMIDFEVISINEDVNVQEQEQTDHKIKKQRNIPETDTSFFTDSDTMQRVSSDHSISGDHKTDQKQIQSKSQERQGDAKQENASKDSHRSKQDSSKRSDTNLEKKDQEMLKDEMNKKTKKQRLQSKDTKKSSKQRKERNNKSKNRQNKDKRRKSRKSSKEKQRSESLSSVSSASTTSSIDSSDSDSSSSFSSYDDQKQSSSSIETRDVNEQKEMLEQQKKKMQKKQHQLDQMKQNKQRIQYSVQDEVKQEVYSENEVENKIRSVASPEGKKIDNKEKHDKKVSKTAKSKQKPTMKKELNKKKSRTVDKEKKKKHSSKSDVSSSEEESSSFSFSFTSPESSSSSFSDTKNKRHQKKSKHTKDKQRKKSAPRSSASSDEATKQNKKENKLKVDSKEQNQKINQDKQSADSIPPLIEGMVQCEVTGSEESNLKHRNKEGSLATEETPPSFEHMDKFAQRDLSGEKVL